MKIKIKYLLLFFVSIISLLTFSSCIKFNCETCGNIEESELIKLTKRNAISSNGNSLSVKATILPSYITNEKLSWSLSWNPSYDFSSWYGGAPKVSNYITITPSTDTLTCSVKVKSSMPTYATLTCTSTRNTSVKATCKIDYVSRNFGAYAELFDVKGAIDGIDLTYSQLGNSAINNLETYKTIIKNGSSGFGSLSGDVKNIRIDYEGEWEGDDGYCFYPSGENDIICEDEESYSVIMHNDIIYVPILFDLYYGNVLIQKDIYTMIELAFA